MSYDKKINNIIFYWLNLGLALIFLMIIVGGLTRLTNSGLSITEWELFKGVFPPFNETGWNDYFQLYKQIPQYYILYPNMTLDEFKIIFYWEYAHRVLGRLIGLFFLIPIIYFQFIKKIRFSELKPYYLILFLIILQGGLGWYMVKSGLVNDVTVSHYRLSLHLGLAIIIISIIFWQIMMLRENKEKIFFNINKDKIPFIILFFLIFIQIIFGAFVSGLDAGKIYQTWPLMGYNYFPDDSIIRNLNDLINFENHSLVQFYHRNLAYLVTIYVCFISYLVLKKKDKKLNKIICNFDIECSIFVLFNDKIN
jgi:cytochrome c oxidase assembly protein subunit 15